MRKAFGKMLMSLVRMAEAHATTIQQLPASPVHGFVVSKLYVSEFISACLFLSNACDGLHVIRVNTKQIESCNFANQPQLETILLQTQNKQSSSIQINRSNVAGDDSLFYIS